MRAEDWLQHRRRNGVVLLLAFMVVQTTANLAVIAFDQERTGSLTPFWQMVTFEVSSAVMIVILVFATLAIDQRFPLRRNVFARNLGVHAICTVPWSLVHVLGMVALRELVFALNGMRYEFGDWGRELVYEYLKDVRSYFAILSLIYLYDFVMRRLQGEASFVPERQHAQATEQVERFLVKMLGKEFLVRVAEIDWIEAAGNYVSLHVGSREYLLRETMTGIEARLTEQGFVRVHRSAIVNLNRLDHIEPFDTGEARAHLLSGETAPVSRSYRQKLKAQLG